MKARLSCNEDEVAQSILQGNINLIPDPPPRALKVILSSSKPDFEAERRVLAGSAIPELQRWATSQRLDLQLFDLHAGADGDAALDPLEYSRGLREVTAAHSRSAGAFLLCLVGNSSQPYPLPHTVPLEEFEAIRTSVGSEKALLDQWYIEGPMCYTFKSVAHRFSLRRSSGVPKEKYEESTSSWADEHAQISRVFRRGVRLAQEQGLLSSAQARPYLLSGIHRYLEHAVRLSENSASRIVCVLRMFEDIDLQDPTAHLYSSKDSEDSPSIQSFWEDLITTLPRGNIHYFEIPWSPGGITQDNPAHLKYLERLVEVVVSSLKSSVGDSNPQEPCLRSFPSVAPSVIKDVIRECQSHVCNCRRMARQESADVESMGPPRQLRMLMEGQHRAARHGPVVVCGPEGCGKSTLLAQVFQHCTEWLGGDTLRVVRLVGLSPGSAYTTELLRNLCLHLSLAFNLEVTPRHYSFELGKLSVWFQDILKLVEGSNRLLVILLDDVHRLKAPPSSQGAILGWLPWNLPDNVHVVCTLGTEAESLLALLRSRITSADHLVSMPTLDGPEPDAAAVADDILAGMEIRYGKDTVRRLSAFLACTSYGLREAELMDLLASMDSDDSGSDDQRRTEFPIAYWLGIKEEMSVLWRDSYVGGRPYINWSHESVARVVRRRYLEREDERLLCHSDLATAFHLGFLAETTEASTMDGPGCNKKEYWLDMLREMDELWVHLLRTGDLQKLKGVAICNFNFLQHALNGASISYVRSVLELVRCEFLDWDVEVLYTMTKQSVDVLSQNTTQLAVEINNWLKPFAESSEYLQALVDEAEKWCRDCKSPLLVPQSPWQRLSLPAQAAGLSLPAPASMLAAAPDGQRVYVPVGAAVEEYHLPSRVRTRILAGHKAPVTCLYVTSSGRWMLTGSEDTDVIVWDLTLGYLRRRLSHHIAGVSCVTAPNNEQLVLSGSEIGVVIVAALETGSPVRRLENHRGPISCLAVNLGNDIFISGSTDRTLCVWNLEDCGLLNTITLAGSVRLLAVSPDSTFIAAACGDGAVHVRALATGSEVHQLPGFNPSALEFAQDSCRLVLGAHDGKIHVVDIHAARTLHTLAGHTQQVVSLTALENDRFLVSAGGPKVVVWNFCSPIGSGPKPRLRKADSSHQEAITCVAVSRDGTLAVTGSKDGQMKVWHLSTGELHIGLEGHQEAITCVTFAPNGLFAVSGSEDCTLKVWGLTLGMIVSIFKEHLTRVLTAGVTADSRFVLSTDAQDRHCLWLADSGALLQSCIRPTAQVTVHSTMVFAVAGKNDSSLKFWPLADPEKERTVSHSDTILCYAVSHDCQTLITGSQDMSLKVWEVRTAKLTQVLVGHDGSVTCVAVAPYSPALAVSGSLDSTLIVWDITTGADRFTLRGHTEGVKCVLLNLDGSVAISGSDDNTLQLWNVRSGQRVSLVDLHASIVLVAASLNASHLAVQLRNTRAFPIFQLLNNPAQGLTLELPSAALFEETKPLQGHGKRGMVPKRVLLKGNLKREQSFDSLYWDLRSASPKHDPVLYEDLKKSAFGSREALHLLGTGDVGRARGLELPPKHKLHKQKLLKKQQSMFAFFPEFTSQHQPPSTLVLKETEKRLETVRPITLPSPKLPEPRRSSGGNDDPPAPEPKKSSTTVTSSVCSVS